MHQIREREKRHTPATEEPAAAFGSMPSGFASYKAYHGQPRHVEQILVGGPPVEVTDKHLTLNSFKFRQDRVPAQLEYNMGTCEKRAPHGVSWEACDRVRLG